LPGEGGEPYHQPHGEKRRLRNPCGPSSPGGEKKGEEQPPQRTGEGGLRKQEGKKAVYVGAESRAQKGKATVYIVCDRLKGEKGYQGFPTWDRKKEKGKSPFELGLIKTQGKGVPLRQLIRTGEGERRVEKKRGSANNLWCLRIERKETGRVTSRRIRGRKFVLIMWGAKKLKKKGKGRGVIFHRKGGCEELHCRKRERGGKEIRNYGFPSSSLTRKKNK